MSKLWPEPTASKTHESFSVVQRDIPAESVDSHEETAARVFDEPVDFVKIMEAESARWQNDPNIARHAERSQRKVRQRSRQTWSIPFR